MSHPTVIPYVFGSPCWEIDRPDQFLQTVARVDASDAASFLACHSPIVGMVSREASKGESEVFDWLFKRTSAETLVVVTGEPGSGKSHFINWLRLRLDDALSRGEKSDIKSIMIKRRSGSLRDALEQMIEQLPAFQHYLDPIRAAITNLSNETAKRQLCLDLSQLLHQSPLDNRRLKKLHDFFSDPGSLNWLCRGGGVIERNVQRLISQSVLEERESLPLLEREDLLIGSPEFCRQIGSSVQELLDIFEVDDQILNKALSQANSFLRSAIERLTGLGNQTLSQVFKNIRQDLKSQGQSLALFIEDVSTLSALDTEVVNILEPQNDKSLCRLYGVLGMTDQAHKRLPENMRGRINLELGIRGSDDNGPLQTEPNHVDNFIARYLNAIRLSSENIERIAEYRRQGSDVRISACEECGIREKCFEAFGNVIIEDQEIGLFPFRPGTAYRLLHGLRNESFTKKNPRGLLKSIVTPVIESFSRGVEHAGINMGLPVDPIPPRDISSVGSLYLGGWGDQSIKRLSYLLYYWTGFEALNQGVGILNVLREPLHLPEFSQSPPPVLSPKPEIFAPTPKEKGENPRPQSPQYDKLIGYLEQWSTNNEPLKQDASFREILLPLIRTSVPWYEMRKSSEPVRSRVTAIKTSAIEIEGMLTRPAVGSSLRFAFPRTQNVSGLLRTGLRFRWYGNNSWNYPDFVSDRRLIGKWLRSNLDQICLTPEPVGLNPGDAHSAAIHALIIAYQFSQKKPLPKDYSEAVEELFSFEGTVPVTFSQSLGTIAQDLPNRVERIREFLCAEFNIPQGSSGGINFIDPLPLIKVINSYKGGVKIPTVDVKFDESHWAPRFSTVIHLGTSSWINLTQALADEKVLVCSLFREIKLELTRWDLNSETSPEQLQEFIEGCKDVKSALAEAKEAIGDDVVSAILSRKDNPIPKWMRVLREIEQVTQSSDSLKVLHFRTEELMDLNESLRSLTKWARQLEEIVNGQYTEGTGGGDLDEEIFKAHIALDSFAAILSDRKESLNVDA